MTPWLRLAWIDWPRGMLAEWIGVAALGAALAVALLLSGATTRLDNVAYDATLRLRSRAPSAEVIIVAIDDRALAEIGPWPWPRRHHAALLDRLTAAGARAVGYDVLFIEPSTPQDDQALVRALAASGRTCLPVLVEAPGPDGAAFRITPPLSPLAQAAAGLGHVDLDYDPDGVSRRANLAERAGDREVPHLMRCLQQVGSGRAARASLPQARGDARLVRADTVLVPYGGGPGHVRTISAAGVLRGEAPPAYFAGRQVIVGATAAGLHDRHATPVSTANEAMAGVEVQANLLQGLLDDRLIRPAALWAKIALTLGLVGALLAALLGAPPRRTLAIGVMLVAVAFALSAALLLVARLWLPPFPAALTLLALIPLWSWRRLEAANAYMRQELERFAWEPDVLTAGDAPQVAGDAVERQIALMRHAVGRARALRAAAAAAARQREQVLELLSHDIRSPQSSILALLETSTADPGLTGKIAAYARRTLDLADNFVHLAKAEDGALTFELLDLSALTIEALDDLWPMADRATVRLAAQGADDEHLVLGDRSLLSRALLNLIDNAIKHSPAGGVVVAALSRVDGKIYLAITDQGPGLDEDEQATLFKRFGRTADGTRGVGLGLTLVDEVATRHGGSITCVSRPGEGATFVLILPPAEVAEPSPP